MRHHKHPGLVGRLSADKHSLDPHPDAVHPDARQVWIPVPDPNGREIDALEGLLCVPTREGAARVAAIPHVANHLALGDELAIADWDGEPLARGELASSLLVTIRVVTPGHTWYDAAVALDEATADVGGCWYDVIGEHAVAAAVPRLGLGAAIERLEQLVAESGVRWEYVTPQRHTSKIG